MNRIRIFLMICCVIGVVIGYTMPNPKSTKTITFSQLETAKPVTTPTIPASIQTENPKSVTTYIKSITRPNNNYEFDGQHLSQDVSSYLDGNLSYTAFTRLYSTNLHDMRHDLTRMRQASVPKGAEYFAAMWLQVKQTEYQLMVITQTKITNNKRESIKNLNQLPINVHQLKQKEQVLMQVLHEDQQATG